MTDLTTRHVVDTTDAHLRCFTHEHPKVFAKFTADHCVIGAALAACFAHLAEDPANQDILFVRLHVDENPVAQKLMRERGTPLFASYCQGRLLECDTLTTETEVTAQLNRLRAFRPAPP